MQGSIRSSTTIPKSQIPTETPKAQKKFASAQTTASTDTTPAQDHSELLGEDPTELVTGFLQMREINSLALASKGRRILIQNNYADKIDPEHLGKGDPVKLYASPEYRKKQYICADQAGRDYLHDLGIKNPDIIAKISDPKNVQWTVDFAVDFLETAAERIGDANPELSSKSINLLMDNSRCPYLAKRLLTEAQILALDKAQVWALSQASVQNAVNSGVLTMAQALNITQYGCYALGHPAFQTALKNGELHIDEIVHLSLDGWSMHDSPAVKKYIHSGLLTLSTAIQLSLQDSNDLALLNVQKQLDSGAIDLQDFLNLTHDQRLELPAA